MQIKDRIEIIIEDLRDCEAYSRWERYDVAIISMDHALELIKELKEEIILEIKR